MYNDMQENILPNKWPNDMLHMFGDAKLLSADCIGWKMKLDKWKYICIIAWSRIRAIAHQPLFRLATILITQTTGYFCYAYWNRCTFSFSFPFVISFPFQCFHYSCIFHMCSFTMCIHMIHAHTHSRIRLQYCIALRTVPNAAWNTT